MRVQILVFLCFFLALNLGAQNFSSDSKKAIRKFEEAAELYRDRDAKRAEELLRQAIRIDDTFIEAYHLIAQICFDAGRLPEAIDAYDASLRIDPEGNPDGYRLLAGLHIKVCEYERALELLEHFLGLDPELTGRRIEAELMRENCLFALEAMKNPVPFAPENLGDSVNSEWNEYWPVLSVDEELLMYTVLKQGQEDFYSSRRNSGQWSRRKNAGSPLNTPDNEGAHSMTADGKTLYFTACNRREGKGRCDIYRSLWEDGNWSIPENLGSPVNSRFSEKQPSISADGRRLIFSSNRPGGQGSYDLWISELADGQWTAPRNLGPSVNTRGMEQSAFLHPDQVSLYFSSTGWPGMGQGDLFFTPYFRDSTKRPVNLGYPINTCGDESGLSINARGTKAYFASDRERMDTDIYTFELPELVRPVPVSYLSGRVYDAKNMKGIEAVIQLIDLESEDVVMETMSRTREGDYLVALPASRSYALNVSSDGYLFFSAHFEFSGVHSMQKPFKRDIPLDKIRTGEYVILNNIFFDIESWDLLPASRVEIHKLFEFLSLNSGLEIELGGHTDNTGSSKFNQELSERRAGAVKDCLVDMGIDPARMQAVGYGDLKPVAENHSPEGRAQNRRTEFTIKNTGK